MKLDITRSEASILAAALARDASRHESQARVVKKHRHHDLTALEERHLRTRIIQLVVKEMAQK